MTDDSELTQTHGRTEAGSPAQGWLRLVVVSGPEVGRRYLVEGTATLGRSTRSTIVIPDPYVSRQQACIERSPDGTAFLVDVSARGTTLLNGTKHTRGALWFGDKVQIGNTTILVTPHDATEGLKLEQDRIQALGYLSAGIAHDFNNMLGVIQSTLAYLRELDSETPLGDEEVVECLSDVAAAAQRSGQLVERILSFARKEKESHELIDFGEVVSDVLHLAARGFSKTIRLEHDIGRELWVRGARAQLAQLMMNLCINARDAMPAGGVLRVQARAEEGDVRLVVEDTGVGMDEDTRERIFERFFTTKDEAGSGLGLATVVEVARWHGGAVSVVSQPGKGTIFDVRLPYVNPARAKREVRTIATPSRLDPRRPGRILIVDDDPMVRRSMGRLLRQWGHEAIEVGDPRRAAKTYAAKRPDLVLLDLDMPGMDGRETWQELRATDPDVAVAFVSGHSSSDWETRLMSEGALGFLQKPFEAKDLRDFVQTVLTTAPR